MKNDELNRRAVDYLEGGDGGVGLADIDLDPMTGVDSHAEAPGVEVVGHGDVRRVRVAGDETAVVATDALLG